MSRATGVDAKTISRYLNGKRVPDASVLAAIALATRTSLDELVLDKQRSEMAVPGLAEDPAAYATFAEEFALVPCYDVELSAGPGALVDHETAVERLAFRRDWLRQALGIEPARLIAVTARGRSMEPTIGDGDLLLVERDIERVVSDAIYVLVYTAADGEVKVKRLRRNAEGGVDVVSDNAAEGGPPMPLAKGIVIAGRVRWVGRMI